VTAHFGRNHLADEPLKGLRVLDVGCGGGLLCEPLSRLGGKLTGIDAAATAVRAAQVHASELGLTIDYRYTTAKVLAQTGEKFDVVLAMEVVEHAADVNAFVGSCSDLVKPGGAMILATLNRTAKAFLFAVVGAEYVLRWLPRGTHDWRRFVRPSELAGALRAHRVTVATISGVVYNPLTDRWQLSRDVSVNYMVFAVKPA
jgi:2-polyprenyl-6-hydroxyphenyl methylase/3-demethylubiquinone-9 3-methyltransferase